MYNKIKDTWKLILNHSPVCSRISGFTNIKKFKRTGDGKLIIFSYYFHDHKKFIIEAKNHEPNQCQAKFNKLANAFSTPALYTKTAMILNKSFRCWFTFTCSHRRWRWSSYSAQDMWDCNVQMGLLEAHFSSFITLVWRVRWSPRLFSSTFFAAKTWEVWIADLRRLCKGSRMTSPMWLIRKYNWKDVSVTLMSPWNQQSSQNKRNTINYGGKRTRFKGKVLFFSTPSRFAVAC